MRAEQTVEPFEAPDQSAAEPSEGEAASPEHAQRELEEINDRLRKSLVEVHHRVKNHLQIVAALIEVSVGEDGEPLSLTSLRNLKLHIQSLAHIHDLLTQEAQTSDEVNFTSSKAMLGRLIPLLSAMLTDRTILLTSEDVRLTVKQSTALALIVNELALNATKHGIRRIDITFRVDFGEPHATATLEVVDDGSGFPEGFNPIQSANTGLTLVRSLVAHSLNGAVRFENRPEGGGRVCVTFPLEETAGKR